MRRSISAERPTSGAAGDADAGASGVATAATAPAVSGSAWTACLGASAEATRATVWLESLEAFGRDLGGSAAGAAWAGVTVSATTTAELGDARLGVVRSSAP
jgi:hypothetical protein